MIGGGGNGAIRVMMKTDVKEQESSLRLYFYSKLDLLLYVIEVLQ